MSPTYLLARDHLEQAATILHDADSRTLQLRNIIERTIGLIDEMRSNDLRSDDNVLDLGEFKRLKRMGY
ncbi:hypothetical protein GCM10007989_07910 [Devosia pacifica]|uniref:Uncharacterized protein n=1 Tax=Devosia pacifica TaxID=1335967 RepID=A0A918VQR2_9HYPH|nr:hypothetical protein [Devosia pacifica]GHA15549.1 hypothetical protein GCM10007989_07910 [Devosia pacifica]